MRHRLFNLVPALSLVLCACFLGLWLKSYRHGLMLSCEPSRAMHYAVATSGRLLVSWGTADGEGAGGLSLDWWDNGDFPQANIYGGGGGNRTFPRLARSPMTDNGSVSVAIIDSILSRITSSGTPSSLYNFRS